MLRSAAHRLLTAGWAAACTSRASGAAGACSGGVRQGQMGGAQWASSSCAAAAAARQQPDAEAERTKMVNKLLYRSRQRGFLELDLLVGLWAEQELPRMDAATLQQFTHVLDQENPDLFKWLTGQEEAPGELQANAAYQALRQHVAQQLAESCHTDAQAAAGKEWVRGWDDSWRSSSAAAAAAGAERKGRSQREELWRAPVVRRLGRGARVTPRAAHSWRS